MEGRWKTCRKISVCIIKEKAVSLLRYGLFCVMCYYYDIKFCTLFVCLVYQDCLFVIQYGFMADFKYKLFAN